MDFIPGSAPFNLPSQTGNSGKYLTTNGTTPSWGTVSASASWGSITGTLSSQTDLQTALNALLPLSGGTMTGDIAFSAGYNPTTAVTQTKQAYAAYGPGLSTSSAVTVTQNSTINNLTHFAVIGWVQLQPSGNYYGMVFTKGGESTGGIGGYGTFEVFRNFSSTNLIYRWFDSSNNQYGMTGSKSVVDGTWHQVLMMYDGSTMYGYVDGALDVSTSFSGTLISNTHDLTIGAEDQPYGLYISTGNFQEFQLYNRALTGTEITNLYNSGAGVVGSATSGLIVGLHLSSGSGTTDADYSGNGFNATLNNMSWVTGHVAATVSIGHVLDPWTSSNGTLPNQYGIVNVGDSTGTLNFEGMNLTSTFNGITGFSVNSLGQMGVGTLSPNAALTVDGQGTQNPLSVTNNGTLLLFLTDAGVIQAGTGQSIVMNNSGSTNVFSIGSSVPHAFGMVFDTWGLEIPGNSTLNGNYQQGIYTPAWGEYINFNDTVLNIGGKGGVNLDLQLYTSQTNNLFQARDTSGNVLIKIDSSALFYPYQHATSGAPSYVKGAMYFDTTLNKLRIGGAAAWETVTSV